jgi:Delta7-sterol 5-desaturase
MEFIQQVLGVLPQSAAQALFMNGGLILIAYLLVWKFFKVRFERRRIQAKSRVDAAQIKSELKHSIGPLFVGLLFGSCVMVLALNGHTKIYTNLSDYPTYYAVATFFAVLLIDDAWFYFVHRALHHPKIFRYVHAVHHKSIDVNPFTSMSFHWIEPFLLTIWIFPLVFLFPVYAPALAVVQIYGMLNNIKSHLGYEFFPAVFNKGPLRIFTTSSYHNLHHRKFQGNYGVHFRLWDKLLRTEMKDYDQEFDALQQRIKDAKAA